MIKKSIIVAGAVAGLCLMGSPAFADTGDTAAKRDVLDTSLVGPVTVKISCGTVAWFGSELQSG